MSKKQLVIDYALSQVGYPEKNSAKNLQSFTEKGDKNYNKFAPVCYAVGLFGGKNKQAYEWCTSALNAFFLHAYHYKEAVEGVLCQSGDFAASCKIAAGYFQDAGRFDMTPEVGDQVFFNVGGEIGHTGLVVDVDDEYITTVEGNSGNMVKKNRYKIGDPKIGGYGHPRYDEYEDYTPTFSKPSDLADTDTLIAIPEMKKGDKGAAVALLQYVASLYTGEKLDIDGEYGNKTAEAVKVMQTALGVTANGEVGRETLTVAIPRLIVTLSKADQEQETADEPEPVSLKAALEETCARLYRIAEQMTE